MTVYTPECTGSLYGMLWRKVFWEEGHTLISIEMWSSHFRVFGYFLPFQASSPHLFLLPILPPPPSLIPPPPPSFTYPPPPPPPFTYPPPPSLILSSLPPIPYPFICPTIPQLLIHPPCPSLFTHLPSPILYSLSLIPPSPSLHNSLVVSKTDCGPNQSHSPSKD